MNAGHNRDRMNSKVEEIERYRAVDDDGNVYVVIVLQEFLADKTLRGGGGGFIDGAKRLVLEDGRSLTMCAGGLMIIQTGQVIRRVD